LRAFNGSVDAFDNGRLKNGSGQQQVRGCRFRLLLDGTPGAWVSTAAVNITANAVHTIKVEWRASSRTITNGGITQFDPKLGRAVRHASER
jgi:hypothetical protein